MTTAARTARRSLYVLATPCSRTWQSLEGTGAVRFCSTCNRNVHDLASATQSTVRGLMVLHDGQLCGRVLAVPEAIVRAASIKRTRQRATRLATTALSVLLAVPSMANAQSTGSTTSTTTPASMTSTVDSDGDSVPDGDDRCPTQRGPATPGSNDNGCPRVMIGGLSGTTVTVHERVLFRRGFAALVASQRSMLAAIAQALNTHPEYRRVVIGGHLDRVEARQPQHRSLALRRAQQVLEALVALGVDRSRLSAVSHGTTQPVAPSTRAAGMAQNRRVSFELFEH